MGRKKVQTYLLDDSIALEDGIKKALKILELDRAAQYLDKIKDSIEKEKTLHLLNRILDEELKKREDLRIERWIKQARFTWMKTIEEYDFNYPKEINRDLILTLAEGNWIVNGGNIIFLGPAGVGKTHLAIALGIKAIQKGYETRFLSGQSIADTIDIAVQKDNELGRGEAKRKLLSSFVSPKLLILDDFIYNDNLNSNPEVSKFLFQIIFKRHEARKSIIFTANEHFSKWSPDLFGSEVRKSVAIDRLLQDCKVISIKGTSYRQE